MVDQSRNFDLDLELKNTSVKETFKINLTIYDPPIAKYDFGSTVYFCIFIYNHKF